jgi:hypothetical protein
MPEILKAASLLKQLLLSKFFFIFVISCSGDIVAIFKKVNRREPNIKKDINTFELS